MSARRKKLTKAQEARHERVAFGFVCFLVLMGATLLVTLGYAAGVEVTKAEHKCPSAPLNWPPVQAPPPDPVDMFAPVHRAPCAHFACANETRRGEL